MSSVNIFCAISKTKVHGSFLFAEAAVTGVYMVMLKMWLWLQLKEDFLGHLLIQQDGVTPHFHFDVRAFLD
jgi:hypothetical protein